jgi:hypothetical protein
MNATVSNDPVVARFSGAPGTGSTLADVVGLELGAPVFAWDWCTAPLRQVKHRSRIDGRVRAIPGWYAREWSDVRRSRASYEPLTCDMIVVDAGDRSIRTTSACARTSASTRMRRDRAGVRDESARRRRVARRTRGHARDPEEPERRRVERTVGM